MSDLTLRMITQAPVPRPTPVETPVPAPTAVDDGSPPVSGARTIVLKNSLYAYQDVQLFYNNNKLYKVVYEESLKSSDPTMVEICKYKYYPQDNRFICERKTGKNKEYEHIDMSNGIKNKFTSKLKTALKYAENGYYGAEKDAFLEKSLKDVIREIEDMVIE